MQSSNHCIQCTLFWAYVDRRTSSQDTFDIAWKRTICGTWHRCHPLRLETMTLMSCYTCLTSHRNGITIASSLTPAYVSAIYLNRALHQDSPVWYDSSTHQAGIVPRGPTTNIGSLASQQAHHSNTVIPAIIAHQSMLSSSAPELSISRHSSQPHTDTTNLLSKLHMMTMHRNTETASGRCQQNLSYAKSKINVV